MHLLTDHNEFEQLIGVQPATEPLPALAIVYFGATWCGPCQRLDTKLIEESTKGVTWLKCDVDLNNYTPGYCNVRTIPMFLAIAGKNIVGQQAGSSTEKVIAWAQTLMEDHLP